MSIGTKLQMVRTYKNCKFSKLRENKGLKYQVLNYKMTKCLKRNQ